MRFSLRPKSKFCSGDGLRITNHLLLNFQCQTKILPFYLNAGLTKNVKIFDLVFVDNPRRFMNLRTPNMNLPCRAMRVTYFAFLFFLFSFIFVALFSGGTEPHYDPRGGIYVSICQQVMMPNSVPSFGLMWLDTYCQGYWERN